ncbi:protein of unknown function (bacteriophge tail fiber protein) [Magnetospirillum sp. XM-1]|uniref:glycine-rich protein n=1 Tax=Magnetospirillum sp. XM-1 TaxID=1663591 RepID=UPI00073DC9B0|nr:glycine-rich protein [Magnetospirillum sp. XM-1]CUW41152.1 protein of unknown function (bacteriophge tail fiber protein) [Magnetospirillum sp. XM-1]
MLIRPTDTLLRLDRPLWEGRDVYDWLDRHGIEPTASVVNMMLMSGGLLDPVTTIYNYTGADQSYTVPWGIYRLNVKLWGGGGGPGRAYASTGGDGGAGGYTEGWLPVTPGQILTIMVGQGGAAAATATYGDGGPGKAGSAGSFGGQGGGRSAIRQAGVDLVTAGGGGGASAGTAGNRNGGVGGGLSGADGQATGTQGRGGTQLVSGTATTTWGATAGGQYVGGQGGGDGGNAISGGGGGGKWGGGGGGYQDAGGGGSGDVGAMASASTLSGTGTTPPKTADVHYATGIGVGGIGGNNTSTPAGHGRVVITTIP